MCQDTNYKEMNRQSGSSESVGVAHPSPLAKPLTLPCGVVLPNRLCKASMTEALADDFGRPTPELCKLYKMWSQGGTGLLLTGNVQVGLQTGNAGNVVYVSCAELSL